jgi:hypothetical protein
MFKRKKTIQNEVKPILCKVTLENRINKNREEIDKWLNGDYPLNLVYMRIRMLTAQNERLISQLKTI